MIFIKALKSFWDPELQSGYEEGYSYTVDPANVKLYAAYEDWLKQGVVEVINESNPLEAKVAGSGVVH